jgi:hypothetical protein
MRNVTFSADDALVERARARARREHTTLNTAFREWLHRYAGTQTTAAEYRQLMQRLSHVKFDRKFTRDEMNQR